MLSACRQLGMLPLGPAGQQACLPRFPFQVLPGSTCGKPYLPAKMSNLCHSGVQATRQTARPVDNTQDHAGGSRLLSVGGRDSVYICVLLQRRRVPAGVKALENWRVYLLVRSCTFAVCPGSKRQQRSVCRLAASWLAGPTTYLPPRIRRSSKVSERFSLCQHGLGM
jgi:hypothetical protein